MTRRKISELRSQRWFDSPGIRSFNVRTRALQMGYSRDDFEKKPVIAILNTWSDFAQCHAHFRQRVDDVKRGVWQAGGLPMVFLPAGPMLTGRYRGQRLGSGSDNWKFWDERRAGRISEEQWHEMEGSLARSFGHCMTMGTASTMTSATEALGLTIPGSASIPAADSAHPRMASDVGRLIVDLVWNDVRPSSFVTRQSFLNAVTVLMALGGSTNAVIHLIAMARRFDIALDLDDFDRISRTTPVLANLKPSGQFLMEDFYYAGGLRGLMAGLAPHLDLSCRVVDGRTLGEALETAEVFDEDVIRPLGNPIVAEGGIAILKGSLAPRGAVIKQSAASPDLLKHRGRAVVFRDRDDLQQRIDDPDLEVDATSVLVLQNAGAVGAPGLPEWGALPIPKKLLQQGVKDMVRISDARMSGTSFGTCVLHVSPESARGGPLALVRDGDPIEIDVPNRRIDLAIPAEELERRKAEWVAPPPYFERGYGQLFSKHVMSPDEGCDFDFLGPGKAYPEPKIY